MRNWLANDKVKKLMDSAYKLLSTVPVTGDAVERMAAARQQLRQAYQLLDAEEQEANDG